GRLRCASGIADAPNAPLPRPWTDGCSGFHVATGVTPASSPCSLRSSVLRKPFVCLLFHQSRRTRHGSPVTSDESPGQVAGETSELIEKLFDHHFRGAVNKSLADGSHSAAHLSIAFVRNKS